MFAIWDALKEADIGIPFPQRDIYIKEIPPGNNQEAEIIAGEHKQTIRPASTQQTSAEQTTTDNR